MRAIAERAEVAQALLHYHFRNKEALYEAVFERRAAVIRAQRQQHLDEAFAGEDPVTLEDVLGVLFMPLEDLLGTKRGDLRFYVQMVAEVTISERRALRVDRRSASTIPSAEQFTAAFMRVFRRTCPASGPYGPTCSRSAAGCRRTAPSARAARLGVVPGAALVVWAARYRSSPPASARSPSNPRRDDSSLT